MCIHTQSASLFGRRIEERHHLHLLLSPRLAQELGHWLDVRSQEGGKGIEVMAATMAATIQISLSVIVIVIVIRNNCIHLCCVHGLILFDIHCIRPDYLNALV